MKQILRKIDSFVSSTKNAPWLFLAVEILAYGLFVWQYGFYWDDLGMSWIRYHLGFETMAIHFSTSRPVWALLFQVTTRILPQVPIYWQVFALLLRWFSVVLFWFIFRDLWPERRQTALIASLIFLLYPGFDFQWVSYLSSHFFIVLCIFLLSYLFMLRAFRTSEKFLPYTIIALVLSLLNLWMMEYFYFLEMIRFLIIFYVLSQAEQGSTFIQIARQAFSRWLPYLLVFIVNVFYRMFVFTNVAYGNSLLAELRTDPIGTILELIQTIALDVWMVGIQAWYQIFQFPQISVDGPRTTLLYAVVVLVAGFIIAFFLIRAKEQGVASRSAFWVVGIGIVAMLFGGVPFWLANLNIVLAFPASRFTLSFLLGISLFIAGLLAFAPPKVRVILATILIALAAGRQIILGDGFRRDWNSQRNMFWQMIWRAPGLEPGTLVLMNEELTYYADNSIGAALNWIYAPDNHSRRLDYVLFYPTNRLDGALTSLEANVPVRYTYIGPQFEGNTSQTVVFYYSPPGCLRLLDPEIDPYNRLIPDQSLMRDAARLSATTPILGESVARMPEVYAPEPTHNWCYYFERADLARQMGDWEGVVQLGNKAFKLDDYPNDPVERFVFVEGYAHAGEWEKAMKYSKESFQVSKNYVAPLLCRLWERIDRETPASSEKDDYITQAKTLFVCNP